MWSASLSCWRGKGSSTRLTTEERQELSQLRREIARLREERDILKKAAAWFAQEEAARARKTRSDS